MSSGHVDQWSHVKSREGWEVAREVNPAHKIFWIDMAFFVGLGLIAAWQTWEYASLKARAGNKGYLFTGAHNLWRIAGTCILGAILIITELAMPGRTWTHYWVSLGMFVDAGLLYIHTEKTPMPLIFPALESSLTILLAFGVSDKGRLTCPIILMIASFRLAAEFWPLKRDEDAFKIVSATLMASLSWHWFPVSEGMNLFNVEKAEEKPQDLGSTNLVDLIFMFNLIMGHLSVLFLLWKILPNFFADELAYERADAGDNKGVEIGGWA